MAPQPRKVRVTAVKLGVAFVILSLIAGVALFQKNRISTMVRSGTVIPIEFTQDVRLREFVSKVKIAGVPVGTVSTVEALPNGLTEVRVKVDDDVRDKLGASPAAEIRPTTMLGGNYYIDLEPGGAPSHFEDRIPVRRTKTPVELDKVAAALQPDARQGIQSSVRGLEGTLSAGGTDALRDLMADAPATLGPAAGAFGALRGTRPDDDLPELVRGVTGMSSALNAREGQLDGVVRDLAATSNVLDRRSGDMAGTLAGMPATLDSTDTGLDRLRTTLGKVRDTAEPATPAVRELNRVVTDLDPVLRKARPVVGQLRGVLEQARPVVDELTPTSRRLTGVLQDVRGPVLDRVNGPVLNTVNSPYHGSGPYAGSGADRPFYQEAGYMSANAARATMTDQNGAMISFFAGAGPGSVAGLPISLEQLFHRLAGGTEGGR